MDTKDCVKILFLLIGVISLTDGACTYPTNLQGATWETSNGDSITFNSTAFSSIAIHTFGSYDFTCELNDGTKYISKSVVFTRFNLPFEAFICMDLSALSSNKYLSYQPTTELSDAGNMRIKIYLQGKTISQSSEICDVTDYANLTRVIMLKDGTINSEKITCPSVMQGYFSYTFDSGSGNVCTGDSQLNTCSDTSLLNFNLTACTQIQAYSSGGLLNCLYSYTSGDYTYLNVYNLDSTVDSSTTYRMSCYVLFGNDTSVYASQYPNNCYHGQTPLSATSPGAVVVFTETAACSSDDSTTTTVSAAASTGLIIGVVIALLAILLAVLFSIWFCYKKKKEEEMRRKAAADGGEDGLSDGLPDESKYDIDRLMYTPDQLLTPSHVHPKVTGKILDKNFEGFGDDEYMDEFGWQDMIDAQDFMNMRKRRDGKDEFEVGDPKDKSSKKKVKNLMKSKKKKKKKGKKKKKKKDKTKQYETGSEDDEYEDIEDEDEEKHKRELTIYLNGAQEAEDDGESPSGRRRARFEGTDDEKAQRKRRMRKDIGDVETVSDIISCDLMIGDLDTEKSLDNEPKVPRLILPNLRDTGPEEENTKKKRRKRTKANRSEQPISFKSFRRRKVDAWLDKNQLDGDPVPMFYEDPKLKDLPPLQRIHKKKQPTLWTDILKKFGGDFKEFEFKNKRNMSENRWRKLLEELYTDKKYFDYVNKSSRGKEVEDDLKAQAKDGLDYLYDRATFWEEQRPIPPRPLSYGVTSNVNSPNKSPRQKKKKKTFKRPPATPMTQIKLDSMDFQKPPRETSF